jgi:hypothetical protein
MPNFALAPTRERLQLETKPEDYESFLSLLSVKLEVIGRPTSNNKYFTRGDMLSHPAREKTH